MPRRTSKIATILVIPLSIALICCYKPCFGLSVLQNTSKDGILSAVKARAAAGFLRADAYGSPARHASHGNAQVHLTSSRNSQWITINDGSGGEGYVSDTHEAGNDRNAAHYRNFTLHAKPVANDHSFPRSSLPRHVTVDYENLLRSHEPEQINYNTRLRDMPGVDMGALDNVYGRIFDRRVLIKQLRYFLERDEFHSIKRLLSENRLLLTKEDCNRFVNDVDHLLQVRLGYQEPTDENMEETMPFLVARYVLQHLIPQDRRTLSCYKWLEPKEMPADVPEYTEDYEEPRGTPEKPTRVEDTVAYRKIMRRLRTVQPDLRLKVMKELFLRIYRAKRGKLFECLWKYQRLKPNAEVWRKRKIRNKVNIDRVSPFLSRPTRCTDEMVKEHTAHFEEAVNKGDLATACRLLKRFVRRIDWKNNMQLMLKFKDLFGEMHRSRKYSLEALRKLRILYWSTVKFRKVLIKINEPAMVHEAGKTMKELYEEQLQNWRERTRKKNDELMRKRGIDMDKVRDFSNIYGFDWVPILYPEEYEAGIKAQEERLNKLRRKAQWVKEELQRRRIREMGDGDEPVRKKGKTPTLWI
ncbi:hypothetical protein, conserved [Babesia ovata]|uniref:Uncharacterized protein n=1 Tax=Babesia ovata TaxID=189622 RepID=A0A2H6KA10_9APIC|nr:uncharacterized protein BOVATA_013190 [Babesia ovata]GBE59826.1 hypothetical protein, conserved [Babesia ovata]